MIRLNILPNMMNSDQESYIHAESKMLLVPIVPSEI